MPAAYPAAQTLAALATCKDAEALLLVPDLLKTAAQKSMDASPGLVHNVFTHAVSAGVRRCASQMQVQDALELQKMLTSILSDPKLDCIARSHLEDALTELQGMH